MNGSFDVSGLNGILAALGIPSIERIIDDTLNNPNNYIKVVKAITYKGKNRTFKNKVSRKRVLHKALEFDEMSAIFNSWGLYRNG